MNIKFIVDFSGTPASAQENIAASHAEEIIYRIKNSSLNQSERRRLLKNVTRTFRPK